MSPAKTRVSTEVADYTARIWPGRRRLEAHSLTGASTYEYEIPVTPSRDGFQPHLSLEYSSSYRNGPFGWGWRLTTSFVGRRTDPQMPRYRQADDDIFTIDGDELVPALKEVGGDWVDDRFNVGEYLVQRYRRRAERTHDRIERWQHLPSGHTHWRVTDDKNVTSLYGSTDEGRESDPGNSTKILRWLLTESFDDRGNIIRYVYKREDLENVDVEKGLEKHRKNRADAQGGARYLKRIQYANAEPHDRSEWHYEIVFDYGDHDDELPTVNESRSWAVRKDVFSDHRAGFEKRIWRRCRRVLMFHNFSDLGDAPVLVSALALTHDDSAGLGLLKQLVRTGYIVRPDSSVQKRSEPAIEFGYQHPDFDDTIHTLESDAIVGALLDQRSGARWIDLHDEALPGLAMKVGGNWCFVRNYGSGKFGEPEVVADTARLDSEEPEIIDLSEIDGTPTHNREYQPSTTMRATANVNQDDPYIGYLDLNGDMADDVIVADEHVIRWYPSQGEEGFGDPIVMKLDDNGSFHPACLYEDQRQSLWVADMSGDGLYDLVRIRSGEVSYWPHKGRGRFGDRVVMDSPPMMPADEAGSGHLLLGDLTASGTSDLVWIGNGEVRYWENLNGAYFGDPRRAGAPGIVPNGPGVAAVDLFGRAADCIVWIDQTSGVPSLRYISPIGDKRPHLMSSVKNGLGGETRCSYVSTAELRRRDRNAGRDQLTSFASPVQVVERIEHRDNVSKTRDLTRYVFRHGAFDDEIRSFIGFAYREEWRSGSQDEYADAGLFVHEPAVGNESSKRAVPTLRKTWTHTGVMFEGEDVANELAMEYFVDPQTRHRSWLSGNKVAEQRRSRDNLDAYGALRGRLLCDELYDVANGTAAVPLTVHQYAWNVSQIQPSRNDLHGSYRADDSEHVRVDYDVEGIDPRIEHDLVLDVDKYGSQLRTVNIAYPRRHPADTAQAQTQILVTEKTSINREDQATWYRLRLPIQETTWQLFEVIPSIGDLYEADEIDQQFRDLLTVTPGVSTTGPHKCVVARKRYRYWSNDLSRILEIGQLESKALLARVDNLVSSDAAVRQLFDERDVADVLRYEGGYEREDGLWWAPGQTVVYSAAGFYLPILIRDALGRQTVYRYALSGLARVEIEDGFGNVNRFLPNNRVAQVWQSIDANKNVVADRFDPLGNLLSRAVMGKPGSDQGDILALDTVEASGRDDPTLVVTYGPFDPVSDVPSYVRTRRRTEHRGNKSNLVDTFNYYDSEGRRLAQSSRSDDGPWLTTNYTILDSQGRSIAVAEPFLSDSPWPDAERRHQALGNCHAYRYDALGRLVRLDQPGGTYVATEFTPWSIIEADANDTILDTAWYANRHGAMQGRAADFAARALQQYEARAAAMAAVHANTPSTKLLDAKGRVVAQRIAVSNQETVTHRFKYNAFGDLSTVVDSRDLAVKKFFYDLMGRLVKVDHSDSGISQYLLAATGEVLRHWDPLARRMRYRYDANGRRTHIYFESSVGQEALVERIIWGGGDVSIPDAEANNLIGVAHMRLSSAGLSTIHTCDWNGNELRTSFNTSIDYEQPPDWMSVDAVISSNQLLQTLTHGPQALINVKAWSIDRSYDAIGRVVNKKSSGSGSIFYEYGAHERLERAHIETESGLNISLLDEVRYDSFGRPSIIRFGNGAWVRKHYNSSGRLSHIVAAARGQDNSLQDLSIAYDPKGNVTIVGEGTELVAAYTYDGADRLVRAEGRQTVTTKDSGRHYVDTYDVDTEGNVIEYRHKSGQVDRTMVYEYQTGHNQIQGAITREPNQEASRTTYKYDNGGALIQGPSGKSYRWNHDNRLNQIEWQNGVKVYFGYSPEGELMRRVVVDPNQKDIREEVFLDCFEQARSLSDGNEAIGEWTFVKMVDTPIARIFQSKEQTTVDYQLVDHMNSVVLEIDQIGQTISPRGYSAYGAMASEESIDEPRFGYRGSIIHSYQEMYFNNGYWYDPALGRYIQPIEQKAERINPYLLTIDRSDGR